MWLTILVVAWLFPSANEEGPALDFQGKSQRGAGSEIAQGVKVWEVGETQVKAGKRRRSGQLEEGVEAERRVDIEREDDPVPLVAVGDLPGPDHGAGQGVVEVDRELAPHLEPPWPQAVHFHVGGLPWQVALGGFFQPPAV